MNKLRSRKMFIATLVLGLTFFSVPVKSQQRTAALRANDTELLMLGTAGGPPLRKNRSEPATLLIVDGRPYLIDCGIGTVASSRLEFHRKRLERSSLRTCTRTMTSASPT